MNAPADLAMASIEGLRLPPHSVEAEQAVIGGLLLSNHAFDRIADVLRVSDFYRIDHRTIFAAIVRLIEDNKPADVLTTADALKRGDQLVDVGGVAYLHQLASATPGAANIHRYAEIVRERAQCRALIEAATVILDRAYAPGANATELCELAESAITAAASKRSQVAAARMNELLQVVMTKLDDLHRNPATVTGTATGFVDLDEMTTGFQDGDLIVIAARPAMGKTTLAVNIAEHVALELKKPVLIFSMEMAGWQLARRMLASIGKVDAQKVRTGRLETEHWDRLGRALGTLNEAPIRIDDAAGLSPLELRSRARRLWREYGGLGLIVIDYLQLMQAPTARGDNNRATEIAEITRSLKSMAKELACPVVLLSQLNRKVEDRANRRPVMADIRDSGAVEQDADTILFLYRDEVYYAESADRGIAELIVGKQRNGPIGTVKLTYIAHLSRFENYSGMRDPLVSTSPLPERKRRRGLAASD